MFPTKFILAFLVAVAIAGADRQFATSPVRETNARRSNEPGGIDAKISGWSWSGLSHTAPITLTAYHTLTDSAVYRVHWNALNDSGPNGVIIEYARRRPGKLYILGDEPDGDSSHYGPRIDSAVRYAQDFCNNIHRIRLVDPTAKFSNGGFVHAPGSAWVTTFVNVIVAQDDCGIDKIAEWNFHLSGNSVSEIQAGASAAAQWASHYGKPLAIGLWSLDCNGTSYAEGDPVLVEQFRQFREWLIRNDSISTSRYLNGEREHPSDEPPSHPANCDAHPLFANGRLTPEGRALAGYPADSARTVVTEPLARRVPVEARSQQRAP